MDMARSMLKAKGMSNYFWAEAVTCAVYLINRTLGVFLTQLRLRHGVDSNPMCNT